MMRVLYQVFGAENWMKPNNPKSLLSLAANNLNNYQVTNLSNLTTFKRVKILARFLFVWAQDPIIFGLAISNIKLQEITQ
jgi:hypothetical protein